MKSIGKNLKTAGCRVFQGVMKIGNYALPYRMPEYIEGPNSTARLPGLLKGKGLNDVLFITGESMLRRGLPDPMLKAMEEQGIRYTVLAFDHPDPTCDDVEEGYRLFKEKGCKVIVAMGGGSRMDCAKGIAAKAVHPNKKVTSLQGVLKVHKKVPTLVAIPTTAGTGSETTIAAVITDSKTHHKASINDPALIPSYAVLDPLLTVGLPPFTTATTGMDALCHAVEAYTNHTYNTKLENQLAKKAVKLIHDNLLTAFEDGKNLEARQNMQKGAFYAGRAFTRGSVGYVHAVGHTLGGLYGVSHGLAMSVILPKVMRQFGSAAHKRLAELADVCGIEGRNDAEKANGFIDWIEDMNRIMGVPEKFDVIEEKDIKQIIAWASKESNPLYPVPVVWGKEDFRKLIDSIRA